MNRACNVDMLFLFDHNSNSAQLSLHFFDNSQGPYAQLRYYSIDDCGYSDWLSKIIREYDSEITDFSP